MLCKCRAKIAHLRRLVFLASYFIHNGTPLRLKRKRVGKHLSVEVLNRETEITPKPETYHLHTTQPEPATPSHRETSEFFQYEGPGLWARPIRYKGEITNIYFFSLRLVYSKGGPTI